MEFDWTIEKFSMCAQLPRKPIFSPDFVIDKFGTKICFFLYPRKDEHCGKYISLDVVKRNNLDYDEFYEDKDFVIQVKISKDFLKYNEDIFREGLIFFNRENCFTCSNLVEREAIVFTKYNCLKLTITIKSNLYVRNTEKNWTCGKCDLENLSSDIAKGLLGRDNHHDLVFKGYDENVLNAHKAILSTRYPNFASGLELKVNENQENLCKIDFLSLKVLLEYLYSGRIDLPNLPKGVLKLIDESSLEHLEHAIFPVPNYVLFTTNIRVRRGNFHWEIPNFRNLPRNASLNKDFSCDKLLKWTKLRFKFYFSQNGENESVVSFSVQRICLKENIYMKCKLVLESLPQKYEKYYTHVFKDETEFKIPNFVEKKTADRSMNLCIKDVLCVRFDVIISNGTFMSEIDDVRVPKVEEHSSGSAESLWALHQDLLKLYRNTVFSDVTIFVEDKIFKAHKMILSVRSPVFCKMFKHNTVELETGQVTITGFKPSVVKEMLSYIYCGYIDSEKVDFDFACELYAVADYYELLPMKKKCSIYFLSIMSADNVGSILELADAHFDQELKRWCHDFVCHNKNEMLNSEEWDDIMTERGDLAAEMLKFVLADASTRK